MASGESLYPADAGKISSGYLPRRSEFTYLLAKKAWKGAVSAPQARRLKSLVEATGPAHSEEASRSNSSSVT